MKSRIWRLAGVGVLCVSVSAQVLADELDQLQNPETDAPWIEQGVDVAMGNKRFDLVQRFIAQWRVAHPPGP